MERLLSWAVIIFLPALALSTWHHRYDLLTFDGLAIQNVNTSLTVADMCDCRTLCVQDVQCSAASVSPKIKSLFECLISKLSEASQDLQQRQGTTTFLKERKPKLFFWSAKKEVDPSKFNEVCSSENGTLGTVFTFQDVQYIRDQLMPKFEGGYGYFIPLRAEKWNGWTGQTRWLSLNYGAESSHPLYKNYEDNAGDGDVCYKISPNNGLTLRTVKCNTGSATKLLCYTY